MRPEQWDIFKRAARREKLDRVPMALIVDSPWIPGYLGIKHMDYYLDPRLWFESNLKIMREFPDVIMVPSWWMEYGMAAEPSVLGAKIKFWQDNTPSEYHRLDRLEDIDNLPEYEVEADGFAALTLHRYKMVLPKIREMGEIIPFVTARGPMCTAGFVRSTSNLMIELVEKPDEVHRLLDAAQVEDADPALRDTRGRKEAVGVLKLGDRSLEALGGGLAKLVEDG